MNNANRALIFLAPSVLLLAGCGLGGPRRIKPPRLDPTFVAGAVIEQLDTDDDAVLSETECARCPALLDSLNRYDRDADGRLAADEIAARLKAMIDSGIGRMPCMCYVYLDGRPLSDAKVELVPEAFFGGAIRAAAGTTNEKGIAKPQLIDDDAPAGVPGVQFGLYQVRISHPDTDLPARYNDATTLGFELSPLEREGDTATFRLKSR